MKHPGATGSLTLLLGSLCTACKATEAAVRKAGRFGAQQLKMTTKA